MNIAGCSDSNAGAGGGGYSTQWPLNPGQTAPAGLPPGTDPCGNPSGCRSVPDLSYPADPTSGSVVAYSSNEGGWTAFGGTSVGAPTNAGLFADTNQGCFARLGRVGPALYANGTSSNFFDVTSGNNDLSDTHGGAVRRRPGVRRGQWPGHPHRPEPVPRAPGRRRMPLRVVGEPQHGSDQRRRDRDDLGRRLRQRHLGLVRHRRHGPDPDAVRHLHHGGRRRRPTGRAAWT